MIERMYMYSLYERLWHWLQALIIVTLFISGLEIHLPGRFTILGFEKAVRIHEILGFILLGNAFLGLFHYLTTGKIKQYFSSSPDVVTLAFRQAKYYLYGIFRGAPHPFDKHPTQKLNPIQKFTYVMILNILLPVQAITGLLLWGAQQWPDIISGFGGLAVLGAIHTMGAWLFAAFVIMHAYLTTTGHKPLTNLRAMITGWEEIHRSTRGRS